MAIKLNHSNYFSKEADQQYISVSQIKSFLYQYGGCEAKAIAQIKREWVREHSLALTQGNYVDAWAEGRLDDWKEANADIIYMKSKKYILYKDFQICDKAINKMSNDNLFMLSLEGEKQKIITTTIDDVPIKIKPDVLNIPKNRFVDVKFMKDMDKIYNENLRQYQNFIEYWGYDLQLAIYAKVIKTAFNHNRYLEPYLSVATKQKHPDIAVIGFNSDDEPYTEFIDRIFNYIWDYVPRIMEIKNGAVEPKRCEKCDYCRSTKVLKFTTHYSQITI